MRVLVVGFGSIGCRHAQSLLSSAEDIEVVVAEPDEKNYASGLSAIDAQPSDIPRVESLDELASDFDCAIVATTSGPRYEIVKSLIEYGVKSFLLEKIVFQSESQFDEILKLLEASQVKAYCNFVRRSFVNYQDLKQLVHSNRPEHLSFNVYGGEYGLASNAVHFMDIFEFTTNSKLKMDSALLNVSDTINSRGAMYGELTGYMKGKTDNGYHFTISSDPDYHNDCVISVDIDQDRFILNEATGKEVQFIDDTIHEKPFNILPTSKLSSGLVHGILKGDTVLTSLEDTKSVHLELFRVFNPVFSLANSAETICPIT